MATIDTTEKWRLAASQLHNEGYFGNIILQFIVGDIVAECFALDDDTLTDLTPDTVTLEAALDRANIAIVSEQQQISDKQSIIALATQSKNFSSEIAALLNAIVNADFLASDTDTRYTAIRTAIAAQGTGFKNRFHAALLCETGLTTVILDAVPTTIQKQDYNNFARNFANSWAFMLNLVV